MDCRNFLFNWRREITAGTLSGVLLAFSFPPYPFRFFSLLALVPLFWFFITAVKSEGLNDRFLKRGFAVSFIAGVAFFGILLYWVANVIPASKVTVRWVLGPGVSLLVIYLAMYPGLFGLALSFLIKRYGLKALVSAPALWALSELLRSNGELAFSWGSISGSMAVYPLAIQGLSVYGPYGLSFFIVVANLLLALALFADSGKKRIWALIGFCLLITSHGVFGFMKVEEYDERTAAFGEKNDIAVVQPNVGLDVKWKPEYKARIFDQIDKLTSSSSAKGARLVIFPETSAPVALNRSAGYRRWLERIATESKVELLVGYIDHERENNSWRSYNAAGLFNPRGELEDEYHKVNLLPFGEKIPFSGYFPSLENIEFGQANFKPGRERVLFDSIAGKFGVLICFESTFAGFTRGYVKDGADFLVNITNDGWFGSERGPIQHSETAIVRAVENGVFVLRAANTGVSMQIDPVGRVNKRRSLNTGGIIECGIIPCAKKTLYTRWGNAMFNVLVILSLAVVLIFPGRKVSGGVDNQPV